MSWHRSPGPPECARALSAVVVTLALVLAGCAPEEGEPAAEPTPNPSPEKVEPLTGKVAWRTKEVGSGSFTSLGGWVGERTAVVAGEVGLAGLDRRTGKKRWTINPPQPATWPKSKRKDRQICGASSTEVGGRIAFTYGQNDEKDTFRCVGIRVVDLTTGKTVWDKPMVRSHQPDVDKLAVSAKAHVEMGRDTVLVNESGRFHALDAATGAERWAALPDKDATGSRSCSTWDHLADHGGGYAVLYSCHTGSTTWRVQRLSESDGKPTWSADVNAEDLPEGASASGRLMAADPVTLALPGNDSDGVPDRFLTWPGKDADEPTVVTRDTDAKDPLDAAPKNIAGAPHQVSKAIVGGGALIVPSGNWVEQRNKVFAFDTESGRQLWAVDSGASGSLVPIAVDGDEVVAAVVSSKEEGPPAEIVRLGLADGRRATEARGYRDHGVRLGLRSAYLTWYRGRVYGVSINPVLATPIAFALR